MDVRGVNILDLRPLHGTESTLDIVSDGKNLEQIGRSWASGENILLYSVK